jgi:hypothetical protein
LNFKNSLYWIDPISHGQEEEEEEEASFGLSSFHFAISSSP